MVKPASLEVVELVEDDQHRVGRGLLGKVVELRTRDRAEPVPPPAELLGGDAQQELPQAGDRLLAQRMTGGELLQPAS